MFIISYEGDHSGGQFKLTAVIPFYGNVIMGIIVYTHNSFDANL